MDNLEAIAKEEIKFPKSVDYKRFKRLVKYLCNRLDYWVDFDLDLSERMTKPYSKELIVRTYIQDLKGTFYSPASKSEASFKCDITLHEPLIKSIRLESNYEKAGIMWDSLREGIESYFDKG